MFYDVIGWIGMVLVLAAYVLLSLGKIKNGYFYQQLNLAAAACMAIGLLPKDAWFSFTLQVIWGIVSIVALIRLRLKARKNPAKSKNN